MVRALSEKPFSKCDHQQWTLDLVGIRGGHRSKSHADETLLVPLSESSPSLSVNTGPLSLMPWVSSVCLFVGRLIVTDGFKTTSLCEPSGGAVVAGCRTRTGRFGQV